MDSSFTRVRIQARISSELHSQEEKSKRRKAEAEGLETGVLCIRQRGEGGQMKSKAFEKSVLLSNGEWVDR